jgi:hypothetical protein
MNETMKHLAILFALLLPLSTFGCGRWSAASPAENDNWHISRNERSFLDSLQRNTFDFFWDTTNPRNGLTPDRVPDTGFASVAAVGFSLTSYPVGVEKGFITRPEAAERTLETLRFLWNIPQGPEASGVSGYKGFFYHYLDMGTGLRSGKCELSTIDTALLMAGVLSSGTYFDESNATEAQIRSYADRLYRRVDWQWAYSPDNKPLLGMGWTPENGFLDACWRGYNEAMILYILALGSPTHPIDPKAWDAWTSTYHWSDSHGDPHVNFGPLFGHQYSAVWVDFRDIQDRYMRSKGIDYFINSTRATYANRAYCMKNPDKWRGYSDKVWGLTASDGPGDVYKLNQDPPASFHAYWARGACSGYRRDDGTIAPTAAGGSLPFAPEITIPTLAYFHARFGKLIYGKYGFKDAFNLSYRFSPADSDGWFDNHYLAIDQGPILLMIENYKSQFVWNLMKKCGYIRRGLERAGFTGGWLAAHP